MNGAEAILPALILTALMGATLVASVMAWTVHGPKGAGLPPCVCRCAHADHVQRFGDPGACKRCSSCSGYEREDWWHGRPS